MTGSIIERSFPYVNSLLHIFQILSVSLENGHELLHNRGEVNKPDREAMEMQLKLRERRMKLKMTQQEVADQLGVTRQTYSNYENGTREPDFAALCALSEVMQCSIAQLLDFRSEYEGCGVRIPILGTVKGGLGLQAQQEYEGYEVADVASPDEYFFLRVTGDSMAPQIQEGDLALVHSQQTLQSGQIGVILLDDDEATVKRVLFSGKTVILQPFNNAYTPIVLTTGPCRILGRVIRTTREW